MLPVWLKKHIITSLNKKSILLPVWLKKTHIVASLINEKHIVASLIKIWCILLKFVLFGDARSSNKNPCGFKSVLILLTGRSRMSLLNQKSTHKELLSHLSICVTVLHMIGQWQMNNRLPDMTPSRMLLMLGYRWWKKHTTNL